MPTVLFINGFRFYFYSSDKFEPAHIHVEKGDGIGKIWLEPNLKAAYFVNFKTKEEKEVLDIINSNKEFIIKKWHEYFNK